VLSGWVWRGLLSGCGPVREEGKNKENFQPSPRSNEAQPNPDLQVDVWALGISAVEMAEVTPPRWMVHPLRVIFMIRRVCGWVRGGMFVLLGEHGEWRHAVAPATWLRWLEHAPVCLLYC